MGHPRGESRLNFLAKLPHHLLTKIGTFLALTREIKSFRPNFEKRALLSYNKSPYVSAYIYINV